MQDTSYIRVAAILGAIAVALGAFGAHGLKELAEPATLGIFETAVRYHFYHVFALLALGLVAHNTGLKPSLLQWAGRFFLFGIAVFSGSLYLLTASKVLGWGMNWLGAVTPIGGLGLIGGWLLLAASAWSTTEKLP